MLVESSRLIRALIALLSIAVIRTEAGSTAVPGKDQPIFAREVLRHKGRFTYQCLYVDLPYDALLGRMKSRLGELKMLFDGEQPTQSRMSFKWASFRAPASQGVDYIKVLPGRLEDLARNVSLESNENDGDPRVSTIVFEWDNRWTVVPVERVFIRLLNAWGLRYQDCRPPVVKPAPDPVLVQARLPLAGFASSIVGNAVAKVEMACQPPVAQFPARRMFRYQLSDQASIGASVVLCRRSRQDAVNMAVDDVEFGVWPDQEYEDTVRYLFFKWKSPTHWIFAAIRKDSPFAKQAAISKLREAFHVQAASDGATPLR